VVSVDGTGTLSDGCDWIGGFAPSAWCIYPITVIPPEDECDYGRPLMIQGAPHLAPLVRREGWTAGRTTTPADPEGAATWARIGLAEHASVASFHRFALELMALGAPESLVRLAHEAATDELRHARLAFGIASDLAQVELGPGPLSLEGLTLDTDLVAFARATAREGCIAETLSALQMAEARDRASDPRQRAVLEGIARDEAKHAALAWRALRWALDQGGEEVRLALVEVFSRAPSLPVSGGLLPPELARASVQRGWQEVVRPAALRLLGGGGTSAREELPVSWTSRAGEPASGIRICHFPARRS
jgi:hypothetical protein